MKYSLDTVRPCLLGMLDHPRKGYIVNMLKNIESTMYKYNITEAGATMVWVPAQVMARLIVQNQLM